MEGFIFRDLPTNSRDFNQRIKTFLNRIPNNFGQYTENFFTGLFMGSLYSFEYTENKKTLEKTKKSTIRSFYQYDQSDPDISILHIVFVMNESTYLRSVVFSKDGKLLNPGNVKSKIEGSDLIKDLSFSQKSAATLYYESHKGFVWEEQASVTKPKTLSLDIKELISKLTEKKFVEIKSLLLTELSPDDINENQVKNFGNEDIQQVEAGVKTYLTGSKKLYQQTLSSFKSLFGENYVSKEAFSHGFLYGGLGFNQHLYIYPERIVGSGRIDILIASPLNPNPIPILIEDKARSVSAAQGINQIVTTYADTSVPTRGIQDQGIIAAFNYDLKPGPDRRLRSDEITVRRVSVKPVNQIMATFFKVYKENKSDRDNQLLSNLDHLYRTRYGIKDIRDYFALLVGHAISFKEEQTTPNKRVFLWKDPDSHNQYGILVIDRENEQLIFDLRPSTTPDLRSNKGSSLEKKADLVIQFLMQKARQKRIPIHHLRVLIDINQKGSAFFNSLEVNPALASSSNIQRNMLDGSLEPLHSVEFNNLFSQNGQRYTCQEEELKKALNPTRQLINNEAHAQALFQGIVSGLPKKEDVVIRFFGESNHSGSGRADGIVKIVKLHRNKIDYEVLFVFELKYDPKANIAALKKLSSDALKQGEDYASDLKSISLERKVAVLTLVIGGNKLSDTDFLVSNQKFVKVTHASTDEEQSPPRKKVRCRRDADGHCIEYSLQDDEAEREVIEELLEARERGDVILIADEYALLVLTNLREKTHYPGKLIIVSEEPERLQIVRSIMGSVAEFHDLAAWLQSVKNDFPKIGNLLAQKKNLINFSELKTILSSDQKPLFKIINHLAEGESFSSLGSGVSAIYLGDNQLSSEFFAFAQDPNKLPVLYKKILFKSSTVIQAYQGSLDYLRQMHLDWEQEKKYSNDLILKETLVTIRLAASCFSSVHQALEKAGLDERTWMPILESAGKLPDHPSRLLFLNLQTHETRTIDLNIEPINEFQNHLHDLYKKLSPDFVFDHEKKSTLSMPEENAEAIDGLNSAFLLQTLPAWSKQKDRTDAHGLGQAGGNTQLSKWIEIHNYIGLAQMGQGAILDVSKVVSLVKTLWSEEQMTLKNSLSIFRVGLTRFLNEGLGILLGGANVVMDIGELTTATTEAQKAEFSTQLAFDAAALSSTIGAGVASFVGATTTAGVLGALATPVAGIGIGVTALVRNFERIAANAQAVGKYISKLKAAYFQGGYQKTANEDNSLMSPLDGAVIKEINFQKNTLHFGNSYLYRSRTKTGSGKSNYIFWAGYFPRVIYDKQQAFSIRERLSYPEVQTLSNNLKSIKTWILPSTPESYLSYDWKTLPFATARHDKGFSILRQLEEREDFDYDFYIFPSEYIVASITPELIDTTFKIILDSEERILIVPKFSSEAKFIVKHLNYIVESPVTSGKVIIHLHEAASLTLVNQHADYTWILVCNDCSVTSDIQFTHTGVNIHGIKIEILNATLGNYYLHNNNSVYKLDLVKKQSILVEINAEGVLNSTRLINSYLKNNSNHAPKDLLIKIDNYPVKDSMDEAYNSTAFYSPKEDHYFYTKGLPVKEMLAMGGSASDSTRLQINFIGCIRNLSYFWSPPCYLWSSDWNTHVLVKRYYLDAEIRSASIIADNNVHIETRLNIYSIDRLHFERYITYCVKPDGELYLSALSDSNDHLLHLLENDNGSVLVSSNISHLVAENWEVKKVFHEENPNHYDPQEITWGGVGERFAHRLNQFVSILPGSQNKIATPLWIRTKDENNYELINPKIQEKNLLCLGALLMKNDREVVYFYKPGSASITDYTVTTQSEPVAGKLFIKSSEEAAAKPLDLPIITAFRSGESIFVVTTEHLIEELDVFGKSHLTAITRDWINSYAENWLTEIPMLISNRSQQVHGPISIYGLHDQVDNAPLGAWYDDKAHSFKFAQPPLQEDGKQFSISYLTTQGGFDFFFCLENGILYQGQTYHHAGNDFNATQLKTKLPNLYPLVTSLKKIYLKNDRWIIETQSGELFSSSLLSLNTWYLEKIGQLCFHQCGIDSATFPENRRYASDAYKLRLSNLNKIFDKNCLNEFSETQGVSSNTHPTPQASFCSVDNFKKMNLGQNPAPCITVNPNKPIPIELGQYNHWWFPHGDHYFFNSHKKINAITWIYLGLCKQTESQTLPGACFFSSEEKMIYFATQELQERDNRTRTKMPVEFAQKQGKNHFLFVVKIDRPRDVVYGNEYFIPLLEEGKTIGLFVENTTPNFPYKIPHEILKPYKTVLYKSNELVNTILYFPRLLNAHLFKVERKGADIVLRHPNFNSEWVFVKGMEVNAFNKTFFSIKNSNFLKKTLHLKNRVLLDTPPHYFETIENIRHPFLQQNETHLSLHYKVVVNENHLAAQNHYQSARLTLEQPGVEFQQNRESLDKAYENTNYFWWISAGAITLSLTALIASTRYLFIRRLQIRQGLIPLAVMTALLPEGTAQEVQEIPKRTKLAPYTEFSVARNCVKLESAIGMLGICVHKERIIVWQNDIEKAINFKSYLWNRSEHNTHYLNYENSGPWALDLNKINSIPLEKILPLLPPEIQIKLEREKILQQNLIILQQQMLTTVGLYVGSGLTVYTPLGDLLKNIGLLLNWQERDDIHFLNRCWITIRQLLSHLVYSEKLLSLLAGILEVGLLYPRIQSTYAYMTNNSDFSKAKSVIRFIGDLLQLGPYNFSYLARLLEFCFPHNESICKISFGVRMVSHLYMLTEDLTYWYLGMALFVLPYLPILLENLGIPVTRGLHKLSNQLAQMFIAQSLLNQFSTDESRKEQAIRELALADKRVEKGKERTSFLTKSWYNFWKETKHHTENPSGQYQHYQNK